MFCGGDEECEGICFRELQDGVPFLTVHKAGQRGGSSSVGKSGQIRTVESREEVGCQRMDGKSRMVEKEMTNTDSAV